jgi:hypothetical protein
MKIWEFLRTLQQRVIKAYTAKMLQSCWHKYKRIAETITFDAILLLKAIPAYLAWNWLFMIFRAV